MRWPKLILPDFSPNISMSNKQSSTKAKIQRTGLTNDGDISDGSHFIFKGAFKVSIHWRAESKNTFATSLPTIDFIAYRKVPSAFCLKITFDSKISFFLQKPAPAGVNLPSADLAIRSAGPQISTSRAGSATGQFFN